MGPIFDTDDLPARLLEEAQRLLLWTLEALLRPPALPLTITALVVVVSMVAVAANHHEENT